MKLNHARMQIYRSSELTESCSIQFGILRRCASFVGELPHSGSAAEAAHPRGFSPCMHSRPCRIYRNLRSSLLEAGVSHLHPSLLRNFGIFEKSNVSPRTELIRRQREIAERTPMTQSPPGIGIGTAKCGESCASPSRRRVHWWGLAEKIVLVWRVAHVEAGREVGI